MLYGIRILVLYGIQMFVLYDMRILVLTPKAHMATNSRLSNNDPFNAIQRDTFISQGTTCFEGWGTAEMINLGSPWWRAQATSRRDKQVGSPGRRAGLQGRRLLGKYKLSRLSLPTYRNRFRQPAVPDRTA